MNGITACCTGHVSFEPELRYTQQGKGMLSFSISVDQSYTAMEGRPTPEPVYVRATAWGQTAEQLADVLKRGMPVYVEGRLTLSTWVSRDGETRSGLSLSAWRVDLHAQIGKNAPGRLPVVGGAAPG